MNAPPIRVLVTVEDRLVRECVGSMLDREEDIHVVGLHSTASDLIELVRETQPRVALVDASRDERGGFQRTRQIRCVVPESKVIVTGLEGGTAQIMAALEAGAAAYVMRGSTVADLLAAIRAVDRGETNCQPNVVASLCERLVELSQLEPHAETTERVVRLTRREREILRAVACGLSNKEVAQQLCIEPQTVKNHMHNILEKMQLSNRYQAVEFARAKGILPRDVGPYSRTLEGTQAAR